MNTVENKYIHMDKLYNAEIKKKFIDTFEEDNYKTSIYYSLKAYGITEKEYDKDIYEMNYDELENLIYNIGASTLPSAENHILLINRYLTWAVKHGLTDTNIMLLDNKDIKIYARKFVSAYKNTIFKEEEIFELVDSLYNDVDKALLLAIYEGIEGEGYSELLNLKASDIKTTGNSQVYSVFLKDSDGNTRQLFISARLRNLLILADTQREYYNENATRQNHASVPFVDSPYIFKKSKRGTGAGNSQLDAFYVLRKFATFKKQFSLPYLTAKDIKKSGIASTAYALYNQVGKLGTIEYNFIGDKYNTVTTVSNGVVYRNVTSIKKILQHPSVIQKYGVDMTQ